MDAADLRTRTIFNLPRAGESGGSTRADWIGLAILGAIAWVGAVAYIGQFRRNQVAQLLYAVAAADILFWGAFVAAIVAAAIAFLRGSRALAGAALVVAAFLGGHELYSLAYRALPARFSFPFQGLDDGLRFALARLAYGAALAAAMLAAWWVAFGRAPAREQERLELGWGDWNAEVRDVSAKQPPKRAWRELLSGYVVFCLVLFLSFQATVGFKPVLGGRLWPLLPAILVAALANAAAEELVFRGLLMKAFVRAGGVTAGLWVQGAVFGLMHWGLSVGVLAALPTSLLIGLGSVAWGKYALDTRGLSWVIVAHALIDVAVMSAYFVPKG